jgi:hypothetical protein
MNYNNKIYGCLKRIEICYKEAIRNVFYNHIFPHNIYLEIQYYNNLHKQINRECDIIIQIGNHLLGLIEANYTKELIIHIRDNGDMI